MTSLTLITNARSYGPFGQVGGTPFQVPMRNNASIVGFFGRADQYLNAIGVYANPEQEKIEQEVYITANIYLYYYIKIKEVSARILV